MQHLIYILVVWVGLVHALPTATKVRCKDPGPIDHGSQNVSKTFHLVGSVILYQCLPGYQLQGGASLTCKSDGNWTKQAPSCKAISCGKPSTTKHGNYTGNDFTYRSVVTYKCEVGYKLLGRSRRRCRSNGKWTKKPRCEKYPRCHVKKRLRLRKGRINITDPSYSHGSKLIFKCNKDYELVGTDEIKCRKGRWSHRKLPHCKLLACPNPGSPKYGFRMGNDFRIGRSVRFVCQTGTKLTGSRVRTCLKNKQWSGSVAVCDDGSTDCPILGTPVSGIKIGNRYNFGSSVRFECKEGYMLQGSSIRRCMANGKWNGTQAKCIEEFQYFVKGVDETAIILRKNIDKMLQYTCSNVNSTCRTKDNDTRARSIYLNKQGLDVLFVFDGSSSIKMKEFKLAKEFAISVVQQLGATRKPKGTRIAAIVYGTKPELVFKFGDHGATTKYGVIKKIRKIRKLGGATATRHTLEMARETVFVSRNATRQRAMFVITDGRSNIGGKPEDAAKILREQYNVHIIAIGVGKDVNIRELYKIGENKEDVLIVSTYKHLKQAVSKSVKIDYNYSVCGESLYDPRGRIIGGNRAGRGQWPWQVGIHVENRYGPLSLKCAGALVQKRWVLTTAHCFYTRHSGTHQFVMNISSSGMYTIKAGDYHFKKHDPSEQELGAKGIFLHPDYRHSPFYENDIALVKLRKDVKLGPFVRTICLPKKNEELLEPGKVGFVTGWGVTEVLHVGQYPSLANRNSKVLLQSAFPVQSNKICDEKTVYYFNSTVTFCAGDDKGGKDACMGDNGGSFVRHVLRDGKYRWVSAGLVSWGEGCGLPDKYGYYTRVAPFVDWIENTIRENTP